MSGGRTCAEVAVVVDAGLGGSPGPEVIRAVRVLQQLRHQFDVVGAEAPLDGYQVRESGRFRRAPIGRGGGERQLRVPPVDRRVAPTPPSSAADGPVHLETGVVETGDATAVQLLSFVPARLGRDLDLVYDLFPLVDIDIALRLESAPRRVRVQPAAKSSPSPTTACTSRLV